MGGVPDQWLHGWPFRSCRSDFGELTCTTRQAPSCDNPWTTNTRNFLVASMAAVVAAVAFVGCSSTPGTGFVSGRLQAVGGPAPGAPRAISGTVIARAPNQSSYSVKVGSDGQFLLQLPVGSWVITGRSPQYEGGQAVCLQAGKPIKVSANTTTSNVDVNCQEA